MTDHSTNPAHGLTANLFPRQLGFRMPAEWEPHAATWLAWPHSESTFPGKIPVVEQTMARWVRELTRRRPGKPAERVELITANPSIRARAERILADWDIPTDLVRFHTWPNNDVWIRDYGPTFLARDTDRNDGFGQLAMVDWEFDAWGGKGEKYHGAAAGLDAQIAPRIAELASVPSFPVPLILEGGSIDVNGAGSLLTTRMCLLQSRNLNSETEADKASRIDRILNEYLGIEQVIWLEGVYLEGDDTDGHIDNLARFVAENKILTVVTDDRDDPMFEPLQRNLEQLRTARNLNGKPFDVITVALPAATFFTCDRPGEGIARNRYPASYANFYIGNGCVLVPTYADANDVKALNTIADCFADRAIIPIDCNDYILGHGAIHCSTQQVPAITSR